MRNSGGTTLITGGAGYIGMLVAEKLLAASRDVRALDLLLRDQQGCAEGTDPPVRIGAVRLPLEKPARCRGLGVMAAGFERATSRV